MRGVDEQTGTLFSYLSPDAMVPQDHPLRVIRPLVNAALTRLSPDFERLWKSVEVCDAAREEGHRGQRQGTAELDAGAGGTGGGDPGRRRVKVAPSPGLERSRTVPPWPWAMPPSA